MTTPTRIDTGACEGRLRISPIKFIAVLVVMLLQADFGLCSREKKGFEDRPATWGREQLRKGHRHRLRLLLRLLVLVHCLEDQPKRLLLMSLHGHESMLLALQVMKRAVELMRWLLVKVLSVLAVLRVWPQKS